MVPRGVARSCFAPRDPIVEPVEWVAGWLRTVRGVYGESETMRHLLSIKRRRPSTWTLNRGAQVDDHHLHHQDTLRPPPLHLHLQPAPGMSFQRLIEAGNPAQPDIPAHLLPTRHPSRVIPHDVEPRTHAPPPTPPSLHPRPPTKGRLDYILSTRCAP